MTCIGNSGPLPEEVVKAIDSSDLVVAGVLSGNRYHQNNQYWENILKNFFPCI